MRPRRRLCLLALVLVTPGPAARGADTQDLPRLMLDVVINHRAIGRLGQFHERGHALFATVQELDSLGLRVPAGPRTAEIPFSALPGIAWRIDARTQTLYLTARAAALKPSVLTASSRDAASALKVESGTGAVLNYDVVGTSVFGRTGGGSRGLGEALLDGRIFSPWGVLASGLIAASGLDDRGTAFQRLDTTYSYADPDSLRRYRLGDIITGGLDWSRPVRMAGGQISTDFSLRPDLVTFPVRTISGQVAVPSSVDVLVNGVQLLSRDIQPGPFEIPQLPLVSGTGDVDVVVRDADGHETRQDLPVYSSNLLLRRGLTAFSAELGVVRLDYAGPGDSYGAPAASASIRHGLLGWLTLEGHAEASAATSTVQGIRTDSGGLAGGALAFTLGRLGAVSLSGAGSRFGQRGGGLLGAAFERTTPRLSLAVAIQSASRDFIDIAAAHGDPVPRLQLRASLGLSLSRAGAFGLAFAGIRRSLVRRAESADPSQNAGQGTPSAFGLNGFAVPQAEKISLLSATYTRALFHGRAAFYATGFHDFTRGAGTGVTLGISIALGPRDSAGVSLDHSPGGTDATVQDSRAATQVGDIGWRLLDDAGQTARQYAVGEYKSPVGLVDAGIDHYGPQTALRGSLQGAIAVADGGVFATNTINDSFAVVDTDGTKGVAVLQENRPVGQTDASGRLLVTDLRSFDANRLSIDPTDIAPDIQVSRTERLVRPQDRSGVVVRFAVRSSRGALLGLIDGQRMPLPIGSVARLAGKPLGAEIGYDGEAYLTGLAAHNELTVTLPNGRRCRASFDFHPVAKTLPRIGRLSCLDMA